jgi:hypothetical protein
MLDGIPAATIEMTGPAAGTAGMPYILCHKFKIHIFLGHAGTRRIFFVGACGVMAHQAVHFCFVCKIKGIVFPTISCMTACATSLVADGADSVVVQGG